MSNQPFQIGDKIFVAWADAYHEEFAPCPLCFGERSVTIILGNGEHQPIECEACGIGYDGPQGRMRIRVARHGVKETEVTGITKEHGAWVIHETWTSHRPGDRVVFANLEEAETRARELRAAANAQVKRNFEERVRGAKKKATYSANYHRAQLKECARKAQYHREKLVTKKAVTA